MWGGQLWLHKIWVDKGFAAIFHEKISSMHLIQEQLRKEVPKPAVKAKPKSGAPAGSSSKPGPLGPMFWVHVACHQWMLILISYFLFCSTSSWGKKKCLSLSQLWRPGLSQKLCLPWLGPMFWIHFLPSVNTWSSSAQPICVGEEPKACATSAAPQRVAGEGWEEGFGKENESWLQYNARVRSVRGKSGFTGSMFLELWLM